MNRVSNKVLSLLAGIGAFPLALFGTTPPALSISTSAGDVAIVDQAGTVSLTCPALPCSTTPPNVATTGVVSWSLTLGTFNIVVVTGQSKPVLGPPPSEDLNILASTTAAGTITVEWSDIGFSPSVNGGSLLIGGSVTGTATSMTYSTFIDSTNALFLTGSPILLTMPATFGSTSGPFTATVMGTISPSASPFSMTEQAQISLAAGSQVGVDFDTTTTLAPPSTIPVGHGEAATIGFWRNKNGTAVIDSFGTTSMGQTLGQWLASTFPNLFGVANPYTGTSLAGLTNAQVAAVYATVGNAGVQNNTYIQAFAVALGDYASTLSLGGASLIANGLAAKYGFLVTVAGLGNATFNVGNNGAAFGVPNGSTLTVFQILGAANVNFNPATGLFYGGDPTLTGDLNNVLNGINQAGDIS